MAQLRSHEASQEWKIDDLDLNTQSSFPKDCACLREEVGDGDVPRRQVNDLYESLYPISFS